MKFKDFKRVINKMTDSELEQELIYNSENYSMSGPVLAIVKAKENLYYTGEDDPAALYTKKQLIDAGYDEDDIGGCEIEVPKGRYYISF